MPVPSFEKGLLVSDFAIPASGDGCDIGYKIPSPEKAQEIARHIYEGRTQDLDLAQYQQSTMNKDGIINKAVTQYTAAQGGADLRNAAKAALKVMTGIHDKAGLEQELNEKVSLPEARQVIMERYDDIVAMGKVFKDPAIGRDQKKRAQNEFAVDLDREIRERFGKRIGETLTEGMIDSIRPESCAPSVPGSAV